MRKFRNENIEKTALAGLFFAIAYAVPFLTGQLPEIGSVLCLMHIPVLLSGFSLGWGFGLGVGLAVPLFRSLTLGMPLLFPNALAMAVELAVYGAVSGLMHRLLPRKRAFIYCSLVSAMILGRLAWGAAMLCCLTAVGGSFGFSEFFAGAVTAALPGIIIQILFVPLLVMLFSRAGLVKFQQRRRGFSGERGRNSHSEFSPLFSRIDEMLKRGRVRLAIEGGSASGKTTLAGILEKRYGCTVFHADDFFLPPEAKTEERLNEPGGNLDRERLLSEVLLPLEGGGSVAYRRYDCKENRLSEPRSVVPGRLTVVEGVYSMHPELAPYYDLSVFLDICPKKQRERIVKRSSEELAERYFSEWLVLEEKYFEALATKKRCELVISV